MEILPNQPENNVRSLIGRFRESVVSRLRVFRDWLRLAQSGIIVLGHPNRISERDAQNKNIGFQKGARVAIESFTEELKQPIALVIGYAELLSIADVTAIKTYGKEMADGADQMNGILIRYSGAASSGQDLEATQYAGTRVLNIHKRSGVE